MESSFAVVSIEYTKGSMGSVIVSSPFLLNLGIKKRGPGFFLDLLGLKGERGYVRSRRFRSRASAPLVDSKGAARNCYYPSTPVLFCQATQRRFASQLLLDTMPC
jgi:hypothetical protein